MRAVKLVQGILYGKGYAAAPQRGVGAARGSRISLSGEMGLRVGADFPVAGFDVCILKAFLTGQFFFVQVMDTA